LAADPLTGLSHGTKSTLINQSICRFICLFNKVQIIVGAYVTYKVLHRATGPAERRWSPFL